MRDFLDAVDGADVVERVDRRGKTAVQTEDLVVDQCCEREVIEKICEELPHICVSVLAQALVVESIHLSDLTRLVISAENGDSIAVSQLEGDEESYCLNRVVSTVNVVAHEQVVCVWRVATNAEQLRKVVLLSALLCLLLTNCP